MRDFMLNTFSSQLQNIKHQGQSYNVSSNNTDLTNQIVCKLAKWKYLVLRKRFFNKFTYWHHFGRASSRAAKFGRGRTQLHSNLLTNKYLKVKPCKRWKAAHLHRRETFENLFHIEKNSFRDLYSFYIAHQDTARYSFCSARENCVSWAEPLKCTTDNLFSSRVFLLNL